MKSQEHKDLSQQQKWSKWFPERLAIYDLNYKDDIIAICSDGAESMKCMGKLLHKDYGIVHIICLAHTIHLVIGDVLYKKPKINVSDTDNDENEENSNDNEDSDIFWWQEWRISSSG